MKSTPIKDGFPPPASLAPEEKRRLLAKLLQEKAARRAPVLCAGPDLPRASHVPDQHDLPGEIGLHRSQFPALSNKTYFNYGAHGPASRATMEAIHQAFDFIQNWGPFSSEVNTRIAQELQQTRASLAAELGVRMENIALTENASMGCNIVLWGLDWQAGDHLLMSDCENPGVVAAVRELQRRFHLEVTTCPLMGLERHEITPALVEHVRPHTRLIVLSHIVWNTGEMVPLAEVAAACRRQAGRKYRVRLLVDGAQSVGVLPLNLTELGVDFYAFTGHKWLCGPEGVGGLYVSPDAFDELQPTFVGWRSLNGRDEGPEMEWQVDGRRFEVASSAYPLCSGLQVALEVQRQWGSAQERYERIRRLSADLHQRLVELGKELRSPALTTIQRLPPESGIVSFQMAGVAHGKLVKFLETQGLMTRTMHYPDCVRVCVHYLTLYSEIDRLLEAIRSFGERWRAR